MLSRHFAKLSFSYRALPICCRFQIFIVLNTKSPCKVARASCSVFVVRQKRVYSYMEFTSDQIPFIDDDIFIERTDFSQIEELRYDSKKAQFLAKQAEVLPSVGLNPNLQDIQLSSELPSDIAALLKHEFKVMGATPLRRYLPYYDLYRKVQCRINKLLEYKVFIISEGFKSSVDSLKVLKKRNFSKWQSAVKDMLFGNTGDSDYEFKVAQWQMHFDYAQTYSAALDTTNTIGHRSHSDVEASAKLITEWRKYEVACPMKSLEVTFGLPQKKPMPMDTATRMIVCAQQQTRKAEHIQRLKNEVAQAVSNDWYMVFETLTFSDDGIKTYFSLPADKRAEQFGLHIKRCGRAVNKAMGRKARDSFSDVYKYYAVPEHGAEKGRFHFHILHFCKILPFGARDPLFGVKHFTENSMHIKQWVRWSYGNNFSLAVRYTGDKFTRDGWLAPRDKNGNVTPNGSPDRVAGYVAKYVAKDADHRSAEKIKRSKNKWKKTLKNLEMDKALEHEFRTRMSRNFGMNLPEMDKLSDASLLEMMNLHWKVTPLNRLLKKSAARELVSRREILTIDDLRGVLPQTMNLLKSLRLSIQQGLNPSQLSSGNIEIPRLTIQDISDETASYINLLAVQNNKDRVQVGGRSK